MLLSKPMLGTQLDRSNPLNDGLALDLLMNEGHGDRANDLSGWGNHGALKNFAFPPTKTSGWNPGMDDVALQFDGVDDYIDCGNNPILDPTGGITIDIQMVINGAGTQRRAIERKTGIRTDGYLIRISDTDHVQFITTTIEKDVISDITVQEGVEYRVTAVQDGTRYKKIYIDGTEHGSVNNPDALVSSGTQPLRIGTKSYAVDHTEDFIGSIFRARILPRAMSAFEVMQTQIDPYGVYLQ